MNYFFIFVNMRRYGYCCINLSLSEGVSKKDRVTTNRSMTKKTYEEKGIEYVDSLVLGNVLDLVKIIEWNNHSGIKMYRMSSDMFPWCSEYELSDLPSFGRISNILGKAGKIAKDGGQRLTFHPSPYAVLASSRDDVVAKAIKELRQHAEIMDIMGLDSSHFYPINIHVNTTQPDKESAASRFCSNFEDLPDSVKKRLVVEVDDKKSQYTSVDLYNLIHSKIGIPITFDYHHDFCNRPEGPSVEESLSLCLSTWPGGIDPIVHYSGSRRIFEDSSAKEVAHSDWIHERIETYGRKFDIELEVKMKDLALLRYNDEIEKIIQHGV